jgi:hypothetical protein
MQYFYLSILFAGDFIPPATYENMFSDELMEVLEDKDFSIVNLEALLTTATGKILKTGNNFKSSPEVIKHTANEKFDKDFNIASPGHAGAIFFDLIADFNLRQLEVDDENWR